MSKRRVCFVTLSRSDYTSLRPVIMAASKNRAFEVQVAAGGSHLLKRFGSSIDQIARDGIRVDEKIDFLRDTDDSDADIARAWGRGYPKFVDYFERARPDFVFVLGDRWEMLAPSTAASFLRIPIVHHSGGDITQGSQDNQTRYLVSTQAHLHLVALQEHRRRLIAMGEEDWRVVWTGEPALTGIRELAAGAASEIRAELGVKPGAPFVLATFHPTPYGAISPQAQLKAFLEALSMIEDEIVLTAPNPDPGSRAFLQALTEFASRKPGVHLHENLGAQRYYAAMAAARYMIGNSSSGIWEAPSFGLPAVNLGERQRDRVRAANVIDSPFDREAVSRALNQAKDPKFRDSLKGMANPYVHERTLETILEAILAAPGRKALLEKKLVDPLANC